MNRLIVHPNSPQAREIELQPGTHTLGRGEANSITIPEPSISTRHCQLTVDDQGVELTDLGSTNGTFVNGQPVRQVRLAPGQEIRLGSVPVQFHGDAPAAHPAPTPPVAEAPRLRLSAAAHAAPVATPPPPTAAATAEPAAEESAPIAVPTLTGAQRFCRSHPKSLVRFWCPQCQHAFCEMCVTTRPTSAGPLRTCRTCAVEVAPVDVQLAREPERSFYAKIPGAFIYPFRDMGIVILGVSAVIFAALGFLSGGISLWATVAYYGLLFTFMQNIIHTTASDEKEPLGFPELDGLLGPALQMGGTVLISFWPALLILILIWQGYEIPSAALVAAVLLGCVYFPMAFLVIAIKDSVLAGNPLIVLPSILRIPGPYSITVVLVLGVYGLQQLGQLISAVAGSVTFATLDMSTLFLAIGFKLVWGFISVYLLTVSTRVLGLLYLSTKQRLAWFS